MGQYNSQKTVGFNGWMRSVVSQSSGSHNSKFDDGMGESILRAGEGVAEAQNQTTGEFEKSAKIGFPRENSGKPAGWLS